MSERSSLFLIVRVESDGRAVIWSSGLRTRDDEHPEADRRRGGAEGERRAGRRATRRAATRRQRGAEARATAARWRQRSGRPRRWSGRTGAARQETRRRGARRSSTAGTSQTRRRHREGGERLQVATLRLPACANARGEAHASEAESDRRRRAAETEAGGAGGGSSARDGRARGGERGGGGADAAAGEPRQRQGGAGQDHATQHAPRRSAGPDTTPTDRRYAPQDASAAQRRRTSRTRASRTRCARAGLMTGNRRIAAGSCITATEAAIRLDQVYRAPRGSRHRASVGSVGEVRQCLAETINGSTRPRSSSARTWRTMEAVESTSDGSTQQSPREHATPPEANERETPKLPYRSMMRQVVVPCARR